MKKSFTQYPLGFTWKKENEYKLIDNDISFFIEKNLKMSISNRHEASVIAKK